jgi:hypothetical protein
MNLDAMPVDKEVRRTGAKECDHRLAGGHQGFSKNRHWSDSQASCDAYRCPVIAIKGKGLPEGAKDIQAVTRTNGREYLSPFSNIIEENLERIAFGAVDAERPSEKGYTGSVYKDIDKLAWPDRAGDVSRVEFDDIRALRRLRTRDDRAKYMCGCGMFRLQVSLSPASGSTQKIPVRVPRGSASVVVGVVGAVVAVVR